MSKSYFPTIGLHSPNEEVSVNFGASPFAFDFQSYTIVFLFISWRIQVCRASEIEFTVRFCRTKCLWKACTELLGTTSRLAGIWRPWRRWRRNAAKSSQLLTLGWSLDIVRVLHYLLKKQIWGVWSWTATWRQRFSSWKRNFRARQRRGPGAKVPSSLTMQPRPSTQASAFHRDIQVLWSSASHPVCSRAFGNEADVQFEWSCLFPGTNGTISCDAKETMSIFGYKKPEASPVAHLLTPAQRERTVNEMNRGVLCFEFWFDVMLTGQWCWVLRESLRWNES